MHFPWAPAIAGAVVLLAAAAIAVGKTRLTVAFLAAWLPLGLLGTWSIATSDPLGAVGAGVWLAASALVVFVAVTVVALSKKAVGRSERRSGR